MHEAAVGVLARIGGTVGPNLGSLVAAVAVVVALALLLRGEGVGRVGLSVAVVVANPWFLVAATSTVDFLWALALWLGAAVVLRRPPAWSAPPSAGVLAGLAVGARSSTAFLVAGLAVAEALDAVAPPATGPRTTVATPAAPTAVVRALVLAGVAAVVGLLVFLPLPRRRASLAFAQNDVPTSSPLVQVGRFLAKDLYFVGPFAAVVLSSPCPPWCGPRSGPRSTGWCASACSPSPCPRSCSCASRGRWATCCPPSSAWPSLRPGPWATDPGCWPPWSRPSCSTGWSASSCSRPDNPNAATGGELTFQPRWGALVVDTQCRLTTPAAWEAPLEPGPGGRQARLQAVWDCAKPWAE